MKSRGGTNSGEKKDDLISNKKEKKSKTLLHQPEQKERKGCSRDLPMPGT